MQHLINFLIFVVSLWSAMSVIFGVKVVVEHWGDSKRDPNDRIKMYCIFARESIEKMKDKNGNIILGKLAAQAGHAFLHSYFVAFDRFPRNLREYRKGRAFKITLVVDTVDDLKALEAKYRDRCAVSLVTDAGLTVFNEPTTTCLGVGPVRDSELDDDIKKLKTLR